MESDQPSAIYDPLFAGTDTAMSAADIDALVEAVLAEATLAEKVAMMSGAGFFANLRENGGVWGAFPQRAGGGIDRLGIEAFRFTDGPRGVARGRSTCFPCSMARGASFDPDLETRIGEIMGIEARAQGYTLSGAVCINLLRHPAWGRAQETYGEDSWHVGVMGAALGVGIQAHNVCATVKHFALNSIEYGRLTVDVRVDERTLHEVFLPHFKHVLDAGIASVMSASNRVNGEYCGQSRVLLTDILRGEWKFDGFVHSDWISGAYKTYAAAAGLDVENPEPRIFGKKLLRAVEAGEIESEVVQRACRRILRTWYRFRHAEDPLSAYTEDLVACSAHVATALESAEKSAVLLKNDAVLPLDRAALGGLAILGRLAALENLGDHGSSRVHPPHVVTPLAGLRHALGEGRIHFADESDPGAVAAAIDASDAVVVVVGTTAEDEGPFIPFDMASGRIPRSLEEVEVQAGQDGKWVGDRSSLDLPDDQAALIETAAESGKPVVVVIVAGSAVMMEAWHDRPGAILQTFYAGMEGGTALARLLFGDVSPSGKLPFTLARDPDHYPFFDSHAAVIYYDYWHGYAKFDREDLSPRYPFGHGLSYARFSYRSLKARRHGDAIEVSVALCNESEITADEVVLCYVGLPGIEVERPQKVLKAFQRVTVAAGETRIVRLRIALDNLRWRDPHTHLWKLETGPHGILVGGSSASLIETIVDL